MTVELKDLIQAMGNRLTGMSVNVCDPDGEDAAYTHSFSGRLKSFHGAYVTVCDANDDHFDVDIKDVSLESCDLQDHLVSELMAEAVIIDLVRTKQSSLTNTLTSISGKQKDLVIALSTAMDERFTLSISTPLEFDDSVIEVLVDEISRALPEFATISVGDHQVQPSHEAHEHPTADNTSSGNEACELAHRYIKRLIDGGKELSGKWQSVSITVAALTRQDSSVDLVLPVEINESDLNDFARDLYDALDGSEFQNDPDYWERGNCLSRIACPQCLHEQGFEIDTLDPDPIAAHGMGQMELYRAIESGEVDVIEYKAAWYDDGSVDAAGDTEFVSDGEIECLGCGHAGKLQDFRLQSAEVS